MLKYALKRVLETIPTTFGIILLTFVLFNVVGGSPAQVILGKNATAESIAAFNHKYGYDLPLPKQFVKFCGDLAKGDFGVSSSEADEPVLNILKRGVGPSLSLTVPILAGGTVVGLMLAMLCAAGRGGKLDRAVLIGSTVLMSVNYVCGCLRGSSSWRSRWDCSPCGDTKAHSIWCCQ
jgi:peptide/nickel transport system permease protein